MIPYDPHNQCPKCGQAPAETLYCTGGPLGHLACLCRHRPHRGEHLCRTCPRCRHRWFEACRRDDLDMLSLVAWRNAGRWQVEALGLGVSSVGSTLSEALGTLLASLDGFLVEVAAAETIR